MKNGVTCILALLVITLSGCTKTIYVDPMSSISIVPMAMVPNTKHINWFYMPYDVLSSIISWYSPSEEIGVCLYGKVKEDSLMITNANLGLALNTSPNGVSFTCEKRKDYVGTLHTHINVTHPYEVCEPSYVDKNRFSRIEDEDILFYVLCANKRGFLMVRDGRFWLDMTWR